MQELTNQNEEQQLTNIKQAIDNQNRIPKEQINLNLTQENVNNPAILSQEQQFTQQNPQENAQSEVSCRSKIIMKKQFKAVLEGQKISRYLHQQRDILLHDLETLEGDSLIEEVIILLKKSWKNRTYRDNRIITKCVSDLAFFKSHFGKNHERMILKCAQYFKYQFNKHGDKVFEQGESGDKFFVILKGRVSIHVDFKRQDLSNISQNHIQEDLFLEKIHIRDLTDGDSFGELALIDKKPRSATITCIGDCHFITFDKTSFDKILKHQQIKMFKAELLRLKKNYLFSSFSGNSLKNIYLLFQIITYNKGDYIIKEGEPSDQIYVIRNGEFKVSRTAYIKIEADASYQLNINQKKKESIQVDLGILGSNQSFGEEEFFTKETRKVNVVCLSRKGELMILNRREFFKKMSYEAEQIKRMEQEAMNKNIFRENQFEKLLGTFGQMKAQVCEDKQGQYLDQQLSPIEQDQLLQKELYEQKLQNDLKSRVSQKQPFQNRQSISSQESLSPSKQNNIVRYHFIRKKVITTHKNADENDNIQNLQTSFYENSSPFSSTDHKKYKLETISSNKSLTRQDSFNIKQDDSIISNKSNTYKQEAADNILTSPEKQISTFLQRLSVMSASLDLRKNSKQQLIELQSHSQCDERKSPLLEPIKLKQIQSSEFKNQITRKYSSENQIDDESPKQDNQTMKILIDQEMQHHSFFLNKRKQKINDNLFFKNLDEKLQANKNIWKFFGNKPKPVVQIKELFTLKEKKLAESKKIHRTSEFISNQNTLKEEDQQTLQQQTHIRYSFPYTLKNYTLGQEVDEPADLTKTTPTHNQNNTLINSQFNRKAQSKKLLTSIVVPFSERVKQIQSMQKEDFTMHLDKLETKKRGFSVQLKNQVSIEINNRLDLGQKQESQINYKLEQSKRHDSITPNKFDSPIHSKVHSQHIIFNKKIEPMNFNITQTNGLLNKPNNRVQSFHQTFNGSNIFSLTPTTSSTKRNVVFNDISSKLPLKYFSSKIKDYNDEIQMKGRLAKNLVQNYSVCSLRGESKKSIDLAVHGIQRSKIS